MIGPRMRTPAMPNRKVAMAPTPCKPSSPLGRSIQSMTKPVAIAPAAVAAHPRRNALAGCAIHSESRFSIAPMLWTIQARVKLGESRAQ
jgi:hypothetical protein